MNGVHDLGGMDGFGAIDAPLTEPPFDAEWEKAIAAMQLACFRGGWFGIDSFRHGIELMDPVTYLTTSYYEHWLHSIEHHGISHGHIDPEELDRRTQHYLAHPEDPLPEHAASPELLEFVDAVVTYGGSAQRPTDTAQRFEVGDVVRVRDASPQGHTRLARYVRGKVGTVIAYRGSFVFPDAAGNDRGEDPQHLYTIQIDGGELWGNEHAEPRTSSTFDAWEPYLDVVHQHEGAPR
ncbi:nitrile hydratase subunit beta [Nocardioides ginsengisegetis]